MNNFKQNKRNFLAGFKFGGAMILALFAISSLISLQLNAQEQTSELTFADIYNLEAGTFVLSTDTKGQYQVATQLDTNVDITVNGMVAKVVVQQFFENTGQNWAEGIYVFPLPEEAAVNYFKMEVDGRIIEGEIKEKQQARKIYEQAKTSGKRASLVEQERPNMFTTSIANIPPGKTIMVEMHYLQVLTYSQGEYQLRFPMTITPRYIPGTPQKPFISKATAQVPDADKITPPIFVPSENDEYIHNPITISANINAGMELETIGSHYHPIITRQANKNYEIILQQDQIPMDRDFVLAWKPKLGKEPKAAVFTEQVDNDYYSLIMILPSHDYKYDASDLSLPREIIFVIDTSGSMSGTSITQAKAALKMAVNRLTTADRFNIIDFDSSTHQLFTHSEYASKDKIAEALSFIDTLVADRGTEMYPAIELALAGEPTPGELRQVVFITDGSVGNEAELFQLIERDLKQTRLFTVGIGSAPNGYFMRKAAQFGRGTFTYIGSTEEVQEKMNQLFNKLEHPLMTNIDVRWPSELTVDMWPSSIPDLYAGEPIVILAKTNGLSGQLESTGQLMGDQTWRSSTLLEVEQQNEGIAALWARKKIAAIKDLIILQGVSDELRSSIVDLALKHSLVTDYTSLVAVDKTPVRPENEALSKQKIANNLPAGSKLIGYPQTATSAQLNILIGLCALLIVGLMTWIQRIRYNK